MALTVVQLLAVILVALALVPGAAHLAALPNKIGLPVDPYFTVQAIYRGWSLFGVVFFAALGATVTLAAMVRARPSAFRRACLGAAGVAAALAVFFTWTFPANQATANWTRVPPDWERLRLQWEYSHAAGALLMLVALGAVTLSILAPDAPPRPGPRR